MLGCEVGRRKRGGTSQEAKETLVSHDTRGLGIGTDPDEAETVDVSLDPTLVVNDRLDESLDQSSRDDNDRPKGSLDQPSKDGNDRLGDPSQEHGLWIPENAIQPKGYDQFMMLISRGSMTDEAVRWKL